MFSGTIFDEPHHLALELLAAKALAENHPERAFELSDRRCRIAPTPQPHCYLLRAEASFRLGQKSFALDDLDRVLETAPDNLEANRRMLAWSRGSRQRKAARSLLKIERSADVLRRAIQSLSQEGDGPYASIKVLDETIEGWLAWSQSGPAEVSIRVANDAISSFITPDPFHVLSNDHIRAASFVLTRPRSSEPQLASIEIDGRTVYSMRMPGNEPSPNMKTVPRKIDPTADGEPLTIIVPVYADYRATKSCIESLLKAIRQSPDTRVVIVDDATPDPKIKRYLAEIASQPGVDLLTNARNCGFVGSINRALRHAPFGDVILLNSDTVVPPGFSDRLRAVARSAPDIGTVNPLSNNGEFSSFPIPNQVNNLATLGEIVALDRLAAETNENRVVDLPSGIGFCLYITRTCLDAVGLLSERYQRGYLEDVDFCLRAREAGLRSVCATSVYIGHVGSRSFKSEKQYLVGRNLEVLDRKFPTYRNECVAFAAANSLKAARQAIERRLRYSGTRRRLIVSGEGAVGDVAQARADQLVCDGQSAIILKIGAARSGPMARLKDAAGAMPQNIEFGISEPSELNSLREFLGQADVETIEIADPASVPPGLVDVLVDGRIPYELMLADGGLLCPPGVRLEIAGTGSKQAECDQTDDGVGVSQEIAAWRNRWRRVAANAERIVVPCPMARAFAAFHFPDLKTSAVKQPASVRNSPKRSSGQYPAKLGILAPRISSEELATLRGLIPAMARLKPDLRIVVIGKTLADRELMQWPNVFVTGAVHRNDLDRILCQYQIQSILTGLGQPLFGHPVEREADQSGVPIARFDWSFGHYRPLRGDLAISPTRAGGEIAEQLVRWIGKQ